jgi:hypothetical protein
MLFELTGREVNTLESLKEVCRQRSLIVGALNRFSSCSISDAKLPIFWDIPTGWFKKVKVTMSGFTILYTKTIEASLS